VTDHGKVFLVGAGPGDPGLITVRGVECLRMAEVVVYDYLACPELLDYVPAEAERVFVGKHAGQHILSQDRINDLLVDKSRGGKCVVRLKGGDPYVFGRGGEEALVLADAGIPFEVIPGVSAAVGASAYAGIPLTHRGYASSFAFIAGYEDPEKGDSQIDWGKIATGVGTLCIYMGVRRLPKIVDRLVSNGRPPETPVAVIRWGTHDNQETLVGTLGDIVETARRAELMPPAMVIVGDVVGLREKLNWFGR
jgi:uroporphyrinogen III methyltransferase / synthase